VAKLWINVAAPSSTPLMVEAIELPPAGKEPNVLEGAMKKLAAVHPVKSPVSKSPLVTKFARASVGKFRFIAAISTIAENNDPADLDWQNIFHPIFLAPPTFPNLVRYSNGRLASPSFPEEGGSRDRIAHVTSTTVCSLTIENHG